MRIGIIGAGHVGTTLGRGWSAAGHEVTYGARDAEGALPYEGARVTSVRGAVDGAEAVALVTPWSAVPDALRAAGDFGGKPLLDVTNPIGPGLSLAVGHTTSGAEEVAARATNARVVKAFNSVGLEIMADPRFGARRALMPVAGDDAEAVRIAARLAGDLGFDAAPLSTLARARDLEPLAVLWITLATMRGLGRTIALGAVSRSARPPRDVRRAERPRAITIAGGGNIGGALARAWVAAGHRVTVALRDAAGGDATAIAASGARVTAIDGAADGADVVVLAVPAGAAASTAAKLGALEGKVVVDCTNAIGKGLTLAIGHTTSSTEELAKGLDGARVVRAFHQQGAETLENAQFGELRAASFIAGDDPDARAVVASLARDVGLDAIDAGPLAMARVLDPLTLLWIGITQARGTRELGLALLRR